MGGVEWQRNDLAHAMTPAPVITQDNYYWYDGLQQVTAHERGDLDPTSGPPYTGIVAAIRQQQESFTFDETGNWNATANLVPGLSQSRTQDQANQITALTGPSGVVQAVYDPAGNMTTTPQPADWTKGYDLVWDAWNRLVKVDDSGTNVVTYATAIRRACVT